MSQIIDKGTVNGIKYFKYQPDIAGANPYFITYKDSKLFFTNSISRNTTRKDFDRPVKYDANSKRILVGPFNFDPKDKQYSTELRRLDKLLDMNEYQEIYLRASTQPATTQTFSFGKEPDEPKQDSKNPIDNITEDNIVYPIYSYGKGQGSDNPMLIYKENGKTMLRRLNKDWKNLKGDDRFYKYDDNKKRTYVVNRYDKEKGVVSNLSLRIDDHKPLGDSRNINYPTAFKKIDYQFGGGETNLRFKSKSKNSNLIDFGTRKIPIQDYKSYSGTDGISLKDKNDNTINFVAGMTPEERRLKIADLPKRSQLGDGGGEYDVYFPQTRSYEYVVLDTKGGDPNNYKFIVRKGDKLYLTNSLPRNANDISTRRPVEYNKNTKKFDIYDYSGAPSSRISTDELQFLSGVGKNSITKKDQSRNSINDGLENFAKRKLQAPEEPKPKPEEPKTPTPEEPNKEDTIKEPSPPEKPISLSPRNQKTSPQPKTPDMKPNDVPIEDIPDIQPEPKGDATGQVRDAGGVEGVTQQDEGIALISADEVNLNVKDEKEINPYLTAQEQEVNIDLKRPDGNDLNFEELDKMKTSYNIDRFDPQIQSKSFVEYYQDILKTYPKRLQYFLVEPDVFASSFNTFLSVLDDTMEGNEMDLYLYFGNDSYKGATNSVPLILNPNSTEQEDADYNLEDRFTQDSFGSVILGALLYRTLQKEKVVLKNESGDGIEEQTFLDHTDNALKSRVAKNFFVPSKMDITQLKFYLTITLATIYAHRQKKLRPFKLNNTIIRIINSIPYLKYNISSKAVENVLKEFKQMFQDHPLPFTFSLLSSFYEKVINYIYELNPNANFEYLFNHISEDLKKLVPSIEKAFRTRQDFKNFILNIYYHKNKADERFKEFNQFIRGRRKLDAEGFSQKFSDGSNIFAETENEGQEYDVFNDTTGELIERVLIPFDPSKKAITLFINEQGRFYESREDDREQEIPIKADKKDDIVKFPTEVNPELPETISDKIKGVVAPWAVPLAVGAIGLATGKLFEKVERDDKIEASIARASGLNAMEKLGLLGFDSDSYITEDQYNDIMMAGDPIQKANRIAGLGTDDKNIDKAILLKKIKDMTFPQNFLGKFYRNLRAGEINNLLKDVIRIPKPRPLPTYDSEPVGGGMEQFGGPTEPSGFFDDFIVEPVLDDNGAEQIYNSAYNPSQPLESLGDSELGGNYAIHKKIVRINFIPDAIRIKPPSFKIFDNVFYKIAFGGLEDQMWVGINPTFLIPLRPVLAVGAGVLINNYLLRKSTPLERIRMRNRGTDKTIDLSIGRPLQISSRVGLKRIIQQADKIYFHSSELKKYDHYFFQYNIPNPLNLLNYGETPDDLNPVNLKDNWQDIYIKDIIDPFFEKYGKFMNEQEKFFEISRFVVSAQAFDQGFDMRLYTPNMTDLNMYALNKLLSDKAVEALQFPNKKDFWIVFESLTFRYRKLIFEDHGLSYEQIENGTKLLEKENFISSMNRLDFIADELPDVSKDKILDNHLEDKTNLLIQDNQKATPKVSDFRYLKLSKLAYKINNIGYSRFTMFPKPIIEDTKDPTQLRQLYTIKQIPQNLLNRFNIPNKKLTDSFELFDPIYYTDNLKDFILITNKMRDKVLIGVAGSNIDLTTFQGFRDWFLTNIPNFNTKYGKLSGFKIRADNIFNTIKEILKDGQEIYISGHSMGASVSNNLALRIKRSYYNNKIHLVGFATPAFLTRPEKVIFRREMKKVLYKNYYIYNDFVGKIGANLFVPDDNNIILYQDGYKFVELKDRYFNTLEKLRDTVDKNAHSINLYGKYLRIAVNTGELKGETIETQKDPIETFDLEEFLLKNPDLDANDVGPLMTRLGKKMMRKYMTSKKLSLEDAIREKIRIKKHTEENYTTPARAEFKNFSDTVPNPEQNTGIIGSALDFVKNLNMFEFLGISKDQTEEDEGL